MTITLTLPRMAGAGGLRLAPPARPGAEPDGANIARVKVQVSAAALKN